MDETIPEEVMSHMPQRLKSGMSMADLRQQFAGKPITTQETQSSIGIEEPVDERTKELKQTLVDQLQEALSDTSLNLDIQKKLQQTLSDLRGAHTRSAILGKAPFAREVISQVKAQSSQESLLDTKFDHDPIKHLSAQINDAWHKAQDCGYVTKQEQDAHQKQQDAIDAMMEEYNQLPANSLEKKALAAKLNRVIEKTYQHDIGKMQELEQKALADGKPELASVFHDAAEAEKELKQKREEHILGTQIKAEHIDRTEQKEATSQHTLITVDESSFYQAKRNDPNTNLLTTMTTNIPAMPKLPLANVVYEQKDQPAVGAGENIPAAYATKPDHETIVQATAKSVTANPPPSLEDLGNMAPPFPKRPTGKGGREM